MEGEEVGTGGEIGHLSGTWWVSNRTCVLKAGKVGWKVSGRDGGEGGG